MSLKQNIAAYDRMKDDLELEHFGEWVVFHEVNRPGFTGGILV